MSFKCVKYRIFCYIFFTIIEIIVQNIYDKFWGWIKVLRRSNTSPCCGSKNCFLVQWVWFIWQNPLKYFIAHCLPSCYLKSLSSAKGKPGFQSLKKNSFWKIILNIQNKIYIKIKLVLKHNFWGCNKKYAFNQIT